MSFSALDSSIDVEYQEVVKQIISSGALDISTEAYNAALSLSASKTSPGLSPQRADHRANIYLSAPPAEEINTAAPQPPGASSPLNRLYTSARRPSKKTGQPTYGPGTHRDADVSSRFKRDSARVANVDRSLLSYSTLESPKRQPAARKEPEEKKRSVLRRRNRATQSAGRKPNTMDRSAARDFLSGIGITPDAFSQPEYEELLNLLLALKHRNFRDLNKLLSLFPYNAALNSVYTSFDKREVRERLIEVLRPNTFRSATAAPDAEVPTASSSVNTRSSTSPTRWRKRRPQNTSNTKDLSSFGPNTSLDTECTETTRSAPGLDYYYQATLSRYSSSSQSAHTDQSSRRSRSDRDNGASLTSSLTASTAFPFSTPQDELKNLREMNAQLMQSHDFAIKELDHVTTKLNKEMAKTEQLQSLLSQGIKGLKIYEEKHRAITGSPLTPTNDAPGNFIRGENFVDVATSCCMFWTNDRACEPVLLPSIDEEVQVQVQTDMCSAGTSPRRSVIRSPQMEHDTHNFSSYPQIRRSDSVPASITDPLISSPVPGSIIHEYTNNKMQLRPSVNLGLSNDSHENLHDYDNARLSVLDLSSSVKSCAAMGASTHHSVSTANSLLMLISTYTGARIAEPKEPPNLSSLLLQLLSTSWSDTSCTHLATATAADVDFFETGKFTFDMPATVSDFMAESYASNFSTFFTRPYDYSLLTLLLFCVYPLAMFKFAGDAAVLLAPVLHDVDKSSSDYYSSGCILFSTLLSMIRAVSEYLEEKNLSSLVSSTKSLIQDIKEDKFSIESSCLLPVLLAIVRIISSRDGRKSLRRGSDSLGAIENSYLYEIFIAVIDQVTKKIISKSTIDDAEEALVSSEQQITLRLTRLAIWTLSPLQGASE